MNTAQGIRRPRVYGYDAYGNRWAESANHTLTFATPTAGSHFNAANNRISQNFNGQGTPPAYDAAGNLTSHLHIGAMAYDAENHQTSFTGASGTTTYQYDGDGRRGQSRFAYSASISSAGASSIGERRVMTLDNWKAFVVDAACKISDRAFQEQTWFGTGNQVSSPDELYCGLFDDALFEDFLSDDRVGLTKEQLSAGLALKAVLESASDLVDNATDLQGLKQLIDDPNWTEVRTVAWTFVKSMGVECIPRLKQPKERHGTID